LGAGQANDVVREKHRVRRTLGYLPQEFGVYPSVSAERQRRRGRAQVGRGRIAD